MLGLSGRVAAVGLGCRGLDVGLPWAGCGAAVGWMWGCRGLDVGKVIFRGGGLEWFALR